MPKDYDLDDGDERRRRRRRKKKASRLKLILGCVFVLAVCCTVLFAVMKWDKISPVGFAEWINFSDSKNSAFSSKISGISVLEKNFNALDNGIIYVSDTSVVCLNHDGESIYSEQHNFTNPLIKSSGVYSIAFNEGGANFRVFSDKGEIQRGVQGTSITDCDINSSGIYCVISDQTGYLSNFSVYGNDNEFIYSYFFNDFYAVTVSMSSDGKKAVVGAVNSVDGRLVSKVYILDFSSTSPLNVFTYSDRMVYEVKFIEDEKCAVITDSLVSVIDCSKGSEVPYTFDDKVLTAYDVSFGNNIVLSLSRSDDGRDCNIVTIDTKGNEIGSFETDLKITSIDVKKEKIALLSTDLVYLYNSYGDSFGSWEVGNDAKSIILPQEKTVFILGVSEIRKISLKK